MSKVVWWAGDYEGLKRAQASPWFRDGCGQVPLDSDQIARNYRDLKEKTKRIERERERVSHG